MYLLTAFVRIFKHLLDFKVICSLRILTVGEPSTDPRWGGQTEAATEEEERQRGWGGDGRRLGVGGHWSGSCIILCTVIVVSWGLGDRVGNRYKHTFFVSIFPLYLQGEPKNHCTQCPNNTCVIRTETTRTCFHNFYTGFTKASNSWGHCKFF